MLLIVQIITDDMLRWSYVSLVWVGTMPHMEYSNSLLLRRRKNLKLSITYFEVSCLASLMTTLWMSTYHKQVEKKYGMHLWMLSYGLGGSSVWGFLLLTAPISLFLDMVGRVSSARAALPFFSTRAAFYGPIHGEACSDVHFFGSHRGCWFLEHKRCWICWHVARWTQTLGPFDLRRPLGVPLLGPIRCGGTESSLIADFASAANEPPSSCRALWPYELLSIPSKVSTSILDNVFKCCEPCIQIWLHVVKKSSIKVEFGLLSNKCFVCESDEHWESACTHDC
jgi:hypothetical protein